MFMYPQSITPAAKAHIDAQYALLTDLSRKMFESAQRINELNIEVAKALMEESLTNTQQLIGAKDPYEALSIVTAQAQPNAEKLRAYQQHLTSIAAGAQVDLARTAESHVPQTSRTAAALADEVARKASEETEKATQRQRAAMEKLITPIAAGRGADGKGQAQANGRPAA